MNAVSDTLQDGPVGIQPLECGRRDPGFFRLARVTKPHRSSAICASLESAAAAGEVSHRARRGATLGGVPTTKPRYTLTDTGHLAELLDAAQEHWPEIADRKLLLVLLAEEGHRTLASLEQQLGADARRARVSDVLKRIPSLVDRELLLSDRAWS